MFTTCYHVCLISKKALVSVPPQKFVHPPRCYYGLQQIRSYEFRFTFWWNNIYKKFNNFFHPGVTDFNTWRDKQIWSSQHTLPSLLLKECIKLDYSSRSVCNYHSWSRISLNAAMRRGRKFWRHLHWSALKLLVPENITSIYWMGANKFITTQLLRCRLV